MKVIIIAAGSSTRLAKETSGVPKGLLKINGKSIIEIQLELFQKNQLSDITIIIGQDRQKFELKNLNYIQDHEFQNHDVLGSLMTDKSIINDDILTSYSDIIFEEKVFLKYTPFEIKESNNGVCDVLSIPKHWSALNPSTKMNKIFGGILQIFSSN